MKFKTASTNAGVRTSNAPLLRALRELAQVTVEEFGGTDALISETGTTGHWDYEDDDLRDTVHFDDSRQASSLAKRVRDGELGGIQAIASEFGGYFDATSVSDGVQHGAWAPDYSSDEYKANKAAYKAASNKRTFCEDNDVPVRELSGGFVAVRFISEDSDLWDATVATEFAAVKETADEDDDTSDSE